MEPTYILLAILGLSILVIVHETGHYLVARAFGMRVTRYSIGLGPALFRYKPKNSPTTFQICAIPLLAYVQIAGMNPHEEFDPDDPSIYPNMGVFARILTIAAGPVANYLTASVIVFGLALAGELSIATEPMVVGEVVADSPAAAAGLRPGDIIREANGRPIRHVRDLIAVTGPRPNQATEYIVERDERRLPAITITPRDEDGRGIIGVSSQRAYPIGEAAALAMTLPWDITAAQLAGMADMVKKRTTEGLIGPPGMVKEIAKHAKRGISDFLWILVLLSVALGLFNLLPFPALDGGRLVFLGYELVTRRRPNERLEAIVHTVGIAFLLVVLVLVTFRDAMG